jgi:hypothetical protein
MKNPCKNLGAGVSVLIKFNHRTDWTTNMRADLNMLVPHQDLDQS